MSTTTVDSVLMELQSFCQQQSVVSSQVDPFAVYWDALRRFFRAQLSKDELDTVLRETLHDDGLVLHNKLLLAMHAAAEKIVMDKAFDKGYAVIPLGKAATKRGGKGTRKHKVKQGAAAAALLEQQQSTLPSSSQQNQEPGKVGVGVNMSGGSFGSGGLAARASSRQYPLYKAPPRTAWKQLLEKRPKPSPQVMSALMRRMLTLAKRAGVSDITQEAAMVVLAAAEHKLQTVLASVTPTPPPREQQRGIQTNPFLVRPPLQRLSPEQQSNLAKTVAQAHEFNTQTSLDAAAPLFKRDSLCVDVSQHSAYLPITLGPSCWMYSGARQSMCLSHPSLATVTARDLRTLVDINPSSVTSTTAAEIAM